MIYWRLSHAEGRFREVKSFTGEEDGIAPSFTTHHSGPWPDWMPDPMHLCSEHLASLILSYEREATLVRCESDAPSPYFLLKSVPLVGDKTWKARNIRRFGETILSMEELRFVDVAEDRKIFSIKNHAGPLFVCDDFARECAERGFSGMLFVEPKLRTFEDGYTVETGQGSAFMTREKPKT